VLLGGKYILKIAIKINVYYISKLDDKQNFLCSSCQLGTSVYARQHGVHKKMARFQGNYVCSSSAITVLFSITLHTYRGEFDWQNIVFMNMYEAGETNLLPMKSHVTIKYFSISMTSYLDFLMF